MNKRKLIQVVRGQNGIDGAGVHLRRILSIKNIQDFDPFLMLDGFDSVNPADYIKGFPWHPHRGIETVTYLIQGEMEHADSLGNKGTIRDLQCQWMTAGSGIIHHEMPKASPRMLGCQLWVNLPAKDKMTKPAYKDIQHKDVPVIEDENATIRIISGHYKDVSGAFSGEYVKVQYLDVELKPNVSWKYADTPNDETLFLYVLEGTVASDDSLTQYEQSPCALLFKSSDKNPIEKEIVELKSGEKGARFILLAAKPLFEPVAWGGPIVMNNREELNLAFEELDKGTFIKHK